jgi:Ser/Thr protein kinase RdoA (MazF antagonist)
MTAHWKNTVLDTWGIKGDLTRLDGEYDLNFLVTSETDTILKVMRPGCDADFVEMQCLAIKHIRTAVADIPVLGVVATLSGDFFSRVTDEDGQQRMVWLLDKAEGHNYACFRPQTTCLAQQLGSILAKMDKALVDFKHDGLNRDFKWNLIQGDWIADQTHAVTEPARRELLDRIVQKFKQIKPTLADLPQTAIHNDVNDYNILVSGTLTEAPKVTGVIDFGDMCAAPRICDLAIAGAYLVLDHAQPESMLTTLVAAYHTEYALTSAEVDLVWPLLQMRSACGRQCRACFKLAAQRTWQFFGHYQSGSERYTDGIMLRREQYKSSQPISHNTRRSHNHWSRA